MNSEAIDNYLSGYSDYLYKWKELCENGEQPVDIKINGLGLFTNAKVIWDNNYDFTLTYDEYIKEYEE